MEKISQESFFDIIWPVVKEYSSSADCVWPFDKLQEYFNKNGYTLGDESVSLLSEVFEEVSDVIRDEIFETKSSALQEKSYEQCLNFLSECGLKVAKTFNIAPASEAESHSIQIEQMNKWFQSFESERDSHLFAFQNAENYLRFLQNPISRLKKLAELSPAEITEEVLYAGADLGGGYGPVGQYVIDSTILFRHGFENGIGEKQIKDLLIFLKNCPNIKKQMGAIMQVRHELRKMFEKAELSKYYEDANFIGDCKRLLEVLTEEDRYHGTNSDALDSIMQNGLFMVQEYLDSTSIPMYRFKTFENKDALLSSLILHRSGFDNSRGEGIVFLSGDADVVPVSKGEEIDVDYSMTGPLGVNYKVKSSNILGTIDLVNRKVKFGKAFEKRSQAPEI